jgi:hypothetical protein
MPIRGLDSIKKSTTYTWLIKAQAQVLKDSIVAIDGFWFLRKYVLLGNIQDLFINRCDERFFAPVLKLIKMASKNRFQILWVWDGLDFKKPSYNPESDEYAILKTGYDYLQKEDMKNVNYVWKQLINYEDIIVQINKILEQFNHSAVRAPYSATAQIAYYLQKDICGYAFCKTDTLIFDGVEKIVTDFHMENSDQFMISVFNKKDFIKSYDLTYSNFRILAFALGCEFCPTIPEYADNFIMENIITIVKTGDFDLYLEEQSRKNRSFDKYLNLFYTAFVLIDFHPVMREDGIIGFYKESTEVPFDFEKYFGKRLPDMLYEAFFLCNISKGILECISKNKKKEGLREISYKLLRTILPLGIKTEEFSGDLENILTKNFKLVDNLNKAVQIIIYQLGSEKILNKSYVEKLITLVNLNNNLAMSNDEVDLKFNYDILEFVYRSNKVLKYLKEVVECYELVTKKKSTLVIDVDIFIFNTLYYEKYKGNEENAGIKHIHDFLGKINNFLSLNKERSEKFLDINNALNKFLSN